MGCVRMLPDDVAIVSVDLTASLEDVETFLPGRDPDWRTHVDLLLGTRGWRRFAWAAVRDDPESAYAWANQITDPELRERTVSRVMRQWKRYDPKSAAAEENRAQH